MFVRSHASVKQAEENGFLVSKETGAVSVGGIKRKTDFIKRVDKNLNYHHERFRKLTFRALALRESEWRRANA